MKKQSCSAFGARLLHQSRAMERMPLYATKLRPALLGFAHGLSLRAATAGFVQQSLPELFIKRVYEQSGLDIYLKKIPSGVLISSS
jgi:hypothetical protein